MISANQYLARISMATALALCGAAPAYAADEPHATSSAAPATESHIMMDHSVGDPKSMNMMKDKNVPIHHPGDVSKANGRGKCKDHLMMDHSSGDPKSMSMMKDKTVPIHNPCKPIVKSAETAAPVDHIMMDHSVGDPKSMSMMKDKKIPTHHKDAAEKITAEKPPK